MNVITKATLLSNSLSTRMSWESQFKPLLKLHEFRTRLGVDNTLLSLHQDFAQNEVYAQKFLELYEGYYQQALFSGDKTVKIFKLTEEKFLKVYEAYKGLQIASDISTEFFPFSVPKERLDELGSETQLSAIAQAHEKLYIFMSTCRQIVEKIEIDPKMFDITEEVSQFLNKFSRLTAFSDNPRQYLDIVVLNPKDFTIELRLDTSSAVAKKDIEKLFRELQEAFVELLDERFDFYMFENVVNFFPFIEQLYLDKNDEGRVVELSFTTDGGYVHNEKDRKKTKSNDVREGAFHQGGSEKCDVYPYKISKRWEFEFTSELKYEYELSLNSSYRELSKPTGSGILDHAVIAMCPSVEKFDELLERLKNKDELSEAV
ncbi:conserved hypothetical protein [Vibrio harveyi]|uniref:hypothetical protein n=1 Tax=Vibrio harveyi group TaxID=717610 RepID=UPI001EFE4A3A|nr:MULTISPECIES: hypothetical protein [Vibrio harveyi group]MCG9235129.1 hypothetical protein [Vibrio harveyi]MCG9587004.1 hypothetical protein [Vibrio harveyi]MCR9529115.1 hypothetical protein [Vibrio alginolyticus]CAH1195905.1 conserved hypothetical protein [Vibrio harveyi]CAH1550795.1 conserved hypothetical protein [Vibrio harveyi]